MDSFFEKAISDLKDMSDEEFIGMSERMGYEVTQGDSSQSEKAPKEN